MRRSEFEIKEISEIVKIIDKADTLRLGLNDVDVPYIVPLSYGYEVVNENIIIYIHGASEGKKHDLINKSSKAFIEIDIFNGYIKTPGSLSCKFESIMAQGNLIKIEGSEAVKGLNLIVNHCGYENYKFEGCFNGCEVYKIKLENISCKKR